jgi:hypothetical protein
LEEASICTILDADFQADITAGGAANKYKPSDNEIQAAREYKEKVRTSSTSSSEKPKGVAGLAKKGKEVFAGLKE